jgi:hypothetical protein
VLDDCSTFGKVCDLSGSCQTTAEDDLTLGGVAVPSATSAIHFSLFSVQTRRIVTEIDAAVAEDGTDPVIFLLYRGDAKLGTYELVTQISGTVPDADTGAATGATSLELTVGKFYLIAIAVTGAHKAAVVEGSAPTPVSFGQSLGGFTYVTGVPSSIPAQVLISDGLLDDGVGFRVDTTLP